MSQLAVKRAGEIAYRSQVPGRGVRQPRIVSKTVGASGRLEFFHLLLLGMEPLLEERLQLDASGQP